MSFARPRQWQNDTVRWIAAMPLCGLLLSTAAADPAQPVVAAANGPATASPLEPVSPDVLKQREQELEAARAAQKSAAEAQAKLKADIAALGQDSSKLSQQLIDAAARVRTVETSIGDAEGRLRGLDGREAQMRASLDSRRSDVVEVLAALQRAGRRSPPALLIRPEDALQSVRTAMLLGALVPE
jgi:septal ring factor EnvC (AmiA/AmiB activator)